MSALRPPFAFDLQGECLMRARLIALPKHRVRQMLPAGLELGPYPADLGIDPGSHPVILCFNDVYRAHLSFPSLIPSMTYHEFDIGVPYTYLSAGGVQSNANGPYYFMPRLWLDRWLPIIGGFTFWGFAKEPASIRVTENSYRVTTPAGEPVASLFWKPADAKAFGGAPDFPFFQIIRLILSQTLISRAPTAVGPSFILSDFIRYWNLVIPIPIETIIELGTLRIPVQTQGGIHLDTWDPGIDTSVLGGFTALVPWRLGLPYIPGSF